MRQKNQVGFRVFVTFQYLNFEITAKGIGVTFILNEDFIFDAILN